MQTTIHLRRWERLEGKRRFYATFNPKKKQNNDDEEEVVEVEVEVEVEST